MDDQEEQSEFIDLSDEQEAAMVAAEQRLEEEARAEWQGREEEAPWYMVPDGAQTGTKAMPTPRSGATGDHWVTVGGIEALHNYPPEKHEHHHGGRPIKITGDGTVIKGPKNLIGKKIGRRKPGYTKPSNQIPHVGVGRNGRIPGQPAPMPKPPQVKHPPIGEEKPRPGPNQAPPAAPPPQARPQTQVRPVAPGHGTQGPPAAPGKAPQGGPQGQGPKKGDRASSGGALKVGEVSSSKKTNGGINGSYHVKLKNGFQGIWKPKHEESGGGMYGLYEREAVCSDIAEAIGLDDLVPKTVVREIDGNVGSIMQWVDNALEAASYNDTERFDGEKDCARSAAFDFLVGHYDRHARNWMLEKDQKKLALIDNGFSMPDANKADQWGSFYIGKYVVKKNFTVPAEVANWDWNKIQAQIKKYGFKNKRNQVIAAAKERFDLLQSMAGKKFRDLRDAKPQWRFLAGV